MADTEKKDFSSDWQSVEMPEEVVALDNADGRLIVTLASGRVVDMTDWFQPEGQPN